MEAHRIHIQKWIKIWSKQYGNILKINKLMEIRTFAYWANIKFFIDCYEKGLDPYIETAKLVYPGEDKKFYKKKRSQFKTCLIAVIYGKGLKRLAADLNLPIEEAEDLYNKILDRMPEGVQYMARQKKYIIDNDGKCNSMFGNIIDFSNEPRERWERLGLNAPIQG